jgi:hypothetical protein
MALDCLHFVIEALNVNKANLRDHMTNLELLFTAFGEEFTRNYTVKDDVQGFYENQEAALRGGNLAGDMRRNAEKKGMEVISSNNFLENNKIAPLPFPIQQKNNFLLVQTKPAIYEQALFA